MSTETQPPCPGKSMVLRPLARSGPAHPSSAPARRRTRPPPPPQPRACALLLQVGSDPPRAPLSGIPDASPRPQDPAASSVASTLPLSSSLSLSRSSPQRTPSWERAGRSASGDLSSPLRATVWPSWQRRRTGPSERRSTGRRRSCWKR